VVDTDENPVGILGEEERTKLGRIDLISRFGRRMDVPSAHESIDQLAIAEEQTAAFARRGLARVRDDLLPERARQDETRTSAQQPPAIAGMTMTSLPSGTVASVPPFVRASSSPM
jgi:hypothetical protein